MNPVRVDEAMAARRSTSTELPLGITPRTLFVTGKGGVGKTTVAAAMALAWRDAGYRTLLVGLDGHAHAAGLLADKEVGYTPVALSTGLWALNIDLENALREYARLRLKVGFLADRLVGNQVIEQFAQAAPGFRELLVMGKLWSLSRATDRRNRPTYEAIVVDAPATGHGLGLLNMAGVVARMFPVGPVAAEARAVDAFVRSKTESGVLLVTLPEEIPVNETRELRERLDDQGIYVAGVLANCVLPDRFSNDDMVAIEAARATSHAPDTCSALDTARYEHTRAAAQHMELERLAATCGDVRSLAFRYVDELERPDIEAIARELAAQGPRRSRSSRSRAGAR
jgi:anion-transporting  ArsA/GET3 family ATPase